LSLTARIGYGSKTSAKYGVEGIPHSFVIGPDGKLAWHGHPGGLSKGTIESALKGAKPRVGGALAIAARAEAQGRLAPIAQAMQQGQLAKALQSAKAIDADTKSTDAEKQGAAALTEEIKGHLKSLTGQAERYVSSKDVLRALEIYGLVAKELESFEEGTAAKGRIDAIRKDPALAKELDAAEAFAKLRESTAKLASSKRRDKFKEFAEKYRGTKAGDRARAASGAK
jgi:hypothetical protein